MRWRHVNRDHRLGIGPHFKAGTREGERWLDTHERITRTSHNGGPFVRLLDSRFRGNDGEGEGMAARGRE